MPKLAAYSSASAYSYAPGIFPSHALLDARPQQARRLLVHSASEDSQGVKALVERCKALGIRVEVADHALARISRKENCYAAVVFDKYSEALRAGMPHILLHCPSDMGNLGTILRTCLGFRFLDLAIIRPAADVFDPRVVRASMGALFSMRIAYYDSMDAYRADHSEQALLPFMLDGAKPLRAVAERDPQAPYTLVFGNEAAGLPPEFSQMGETVRIPHDLAIDSLNLAVAVSIAAYAFSEDRFDQRPSSASRHETI